MSPDRRLAIIRQLAAFRDGAYGIKMHRHYVSDVLLEELFDDAWVKMERSEQMNIILRLSQWTSDANKMLRRIYRIALAQKRLGR